MRGTMGIGTPEKTHSCGWSPAGRTATPIAALLAGMVLAACPIEFPLDPEPDYHHVTFELDGQRVTCNYGRPDVDGMNPTVALSPDGTQLNIHSSTAGPENDPQHAVGLYGWLTASDPGVYIGAYDGTIGMTGMVLVITEELVEYAYSHPSSGYATIDVFGPVGGDVAGSFDIVFEAMEDGAPSYGETLRATGTFKLLRVADSFFIE